jgi:general secretion pathway protein I
VPNRSSQTGERGFTLIEVLVALTILSISLVVLLGIFSQGLALAEENAKEADARNLAQSLLAQTETAPHPAFGDTNGVSNGLRWRVRITPYGSGADQQAWQGIAQQIDATVMWDGEGRPRSLTLTTLRLNGATGNASGDAQ